MGSGGWSVPSIVEEHVVQLGKSEAKYVLLIEKDAVWKRFNEDKFWQREKCIIVTGQGQPPRGVRRLVQRLHSELKLPVYVLVDNDPWGFYIYSVLKQGSINLAYESMRMAVPAARFVGLSSFDKTKYKIPANVAITMNDQDNSRAKQMLAYPWFQAQVAEGDPGDGRLGQKFELEALSRRGISFITEEYLPQEAEGEGLARVTPAGGGLTSSAPIARLRAISGCEPEEERDMAAIKGNRSKKKNANRSKVKRIQAKRKRALSVKRKRK